MVKWATAMESKAPKVGLAKSRRLLIPKCGVTQVSRVGLTNCTGKKTVICSRSILLPFIHCVIINKSTIKDVYDARMSTIIIPLRRFVSSSCLKSLHGFTWAWRRGHLYTPNISGSCAGFFALHTPKEKSVVRQSCGFPSFVRQPIRFVLPTLVRVFLLLKWPNTESSVPQTVPILLGLNDLVTFSLPPILALRCWWR